MTIKENVKISVIVSTYNWPESLNLVLESLRTQTDKNFEVLIADDGSEKETKDLIGNYQKNFPVPLIHIWHEDLGFRLSSIRNLALKSATGKYIIFLDGDCVVKNDFVSRHRQLASPEFFVTGTRILVSQAFTKKILNESINLEKLKLKNLFGLFLKGNINKFFPLIPLWIPRYLHPRKWQYLRGCNFAVWKKDLVSVNGFDESFKGWGYEDSDLAVRLINSGIKRKSGKFQVPVFHLWHRTATKGKKNPNWNLLQERIKSKTTTTKNGIVKLPG